MIIKIIEPNNLKFYYYNIQ